MIVIISTTTFVVLASAVLIAQQVFGDRRQVARSLRQASVSTAESWDLRSRQLAEPFGARLLVPLWERLRARLGRMAPSGLMARLDQELIHAGSPRGWDGERLVAVKLALAIGLTVTVPFWAPAINFGGTRLFFIGPLAAFVGWFAPEWVARSKSGERQAAIARALPDALDLLAITVQAGLAFDGALDRVARQMDGPLAQEFRRVVQEMRLGTSRADALRGLRDRTNVQELHSFVLALIQADRFGISIATVLRVQAEEIRLKRRQHAEEQAQKLPVKIIMPLMSCIFPGLFVVLLGPAVLNIYDNLLAR